MYYKIEAEELKRLLKAKMELQALNFGGVDNWSYYGDAVWDYIAQWNLENGKEDLELDLDDIAAIMMEGYEKL